MMKKFAFVLFAICFGYNLLSATDFRYLRPYEGLKDSEINSIVQDSKGITWFATWSGLIRYNGYEFKHYRPELGNPESLPTKKVKQLFVDSKDNLWIVTDHYLSLYRKETNSFYTIGFQRADEPNLNIITLSEFENKLVIQALDGFYFIELNKEIDGSTLAKKIRIKSSDPNWQHYFNHSFSARDSFFLFTNYFSSNEFAVFKGNFSYAEGKPQIFIQEIARSRGLVNKTDYSLLDNTLYIATNEGVKLFSLSSNSFLGRTYFSGEDIRSIHYASDNRVYCASFDPNLRYIDLHRGTTGFYSGNPFRWGSLLNNTILCIYEGFSGNLWIGHQGQGISILNIYNKEFQTFRHNPFDKNSLISNTVMCFGGENEEIFIGCRVGGISVMKPKPRTRNEYDFEIIKLLQDGKESFFNHGIWDIEKLNEEHYLVGTLSGTYELQKHGNRWYLSPFSNDPIFNGSTRTIFVDDNKNIWMGVVDYGLVLIPRLSINPDKSYFLYPSVKHDEKTISESTILSMYLDSENRFWMGTANGLNLLTESYDKINLTGTQKPDLKFKRYIAVKPDQSFLNNNEVNCIFENYDKSLWIATQGGGINIYHPERDSFSHLTTEDGLPSNDVLGILKDENGTLWISTKNDLVSYNQFAEDPVFVGYNYYDGTQGNIYMVNSYYKSPGGEMFFGGDYGFTRFHPDLIKPNSVPPKLVFTDLKIYEEAVSVGDTIHKSFVLKQTLDYTNDIKIPYSVKVFSVGIAAIHYQYPPDNYYKYKLEGFDRRWKTIPASETYLQFSNLQPGDYTLKVKAFNSDDVALDEIRELKIKITPPWYGEWYFVLLFSLMSVSVILVFAWMLYNRQKMTYQKKLDDLSIQTNESKMLFLTNIAHGLRTPLSLVIGPVEDMIQNYNDVNPKWRNHLFLIHRNSNYLLKLINQIIDFRKLHAGKLTLYRQNVDIARLIKEVGINFKGLEGRRRIRLDFDLPEDPVIVSVDSQKIEEILYNLLSNAFKHTPDDGSIQISLKSEEEKIQISVFNEGSEIEESDKNRIFERFYKKDELSEGAGIGLSFSRSLAELHEGTIEYESYEGRGVVFNIILPNRRDHEHTVDHVEPVLQSDNSSLPDRDEVEEIMDRDDDNELKILLVEDNEDLREFLKNVLSKQYSVYEAGNGREGIRIVKNVMPDIVISDIIMPIMDGYELCKEIKDTQSTCHIPVILLTAKDTNEQVISGYEVGADAYVTKPFDLGIISSQISRLIKNRKLIRKKYLDQNFMIEVKQNKLSKDDEFIINVRKLLETNISNPDYNVKELASSLHISSTQLYRKVKALTGHSPGEFIRIIKLQKAYELLIKRSKSVKEVCFISGFNNVSYFIKCFKDQYGVTPASVRNKGGIAVDENNKISSKI